MAQSKLAVMSTKDAFAGFGLTNFFTHLPKNLKSVIKDPAGYKDTHVKACARMIIVAASGFGKGNFLLNFINKQGFSKIFIYSKTLEADPLYQMLQQKLEPDQLVTGTSLEQIPDLKVEDVGNADEPKLLVIDDLINESNQKKAMEYFCNSRKYGFSICLLSQSFHKIPKIIRLNSDYIALGRTNSTLDIQTLLRNYDLPYNSKQMQEIYKHCTKVRGNFLFIDLVDTDIRYQVRMNFGADEKQKNSLATKAPSAIKS
jgi:hypothetical protein